MALDIRPCFSYIPSESRSPRTPPGEGTFRRSGRVRCLRAGRYTLSSGSFGHQSPGTMTGAGSVPWAGTGEGRQHLLRPRPRKPGLELSLRDDDSLWREPWWDADRRAAHRRAEPHPMVRRIRISVCRRSASLIYCRSEWRTRSSEWKDGDPPLCFGSQAQNSRFTWQRFGNSDPEAACPGTARHCELWRSNPGRLARRGVLDCFVASLLAMTMALIRPHDSGGGGTARLRGGGGDDLTAPQVLRRTSRL